MKKTIIGIVVGVLVGTTANVIASTMLASNIAYTPKDSTWKVNNVEAAIDSLKLSKTSDNYSTEEKVVGTWIDGKPLYQKTIRLESITITSTSKNEILLDLTDKNVINTFGNIIWNDNTYRTLPFIYNVNNNIFVGIVQIGDNLVLQYWRSSGSTVATNANITIQYTKTTDTATN